MCLLFESIKVYGNKIINPDYHEQRMNRSRFNLFGCEEDIHFESKITLPKYLNKDKVYKLRITYKETIQYVEFIEYQKRATKSLQIVESNDIEYSYKYNLRENLNTLLKQKKDSDDILIIKNNLVTDSSYSNIVFYDGSGWITPNTPLLLGTKRAYLLAKGAITERKITLQDIKTFQKACIINAFLDIESNNEIIIHY